MRRCTFQSVTRVPGGEMTARGNADIHRVYPHTRGLGGAALHKVHWRLVALKAKLSLDILNIQRNITQHTKEVNL